MKQYRHKSQAKGWKLRLAFSFGFFMMLLSLTACEVQPSPEALSTSADTLLSTIILEPEISQPNPTQTQTPTTAMPISSPTQPLPQATDALPTSTLSICSSPASLTPAMTEGPYFKAGSPERTSLVEPDTAGTQLVLTGYVLTTDCQPVAQVRLDFWQADANGQYDNTGYHLRGHQFTDEKGFYQLKTVVPGIYPGRTEHIHLKVQAPNGPTLTSQIFFPGVPDNESDRIFDPLLVIQITQESSTQVEATYNFIITP